MSSIAIGSRTPGRARALAAGAALVLVLAACSNGGGGATTGATQPAATTPPATAGAGSPAPASGGPTDVTIDVATDATAGDYITGANGMSLYLFKTDGDNMSNCTGNCAAAWPAFTVPDGTTVHLGPGVTGTLETFKRDDGRTQVAINKQPLYYFSGDTAAGDVKGQGINEVWYLVDPSGSAISTGGKGSY